MCKWRLTAVEGTSDLKMFKKLTLIRKSGSERVSCSRQRCGLVNDPEERIVA